ncbi:hypothetical protein JNL27_05025 [bacterium]|nr:hypothetical protein [bacterium]
MTCRFAFLIYVLFSVSLYAQSPTTSNTKNLVGRFSTGWNYYTKGNSLSPQLNSFNNYVFLNYRVFDPNSQEVKYQFKFDFYEKTALSSTRSVTEGNQFQNRYVVKQLYASYGDNYRQIKIGRIIPMINVVDAYPINGFSAENIRVGNWFDVSAFGGTINDYYKNDPLGNGYNYGFSALHQCARWSVGAGFTGEKFETTVLTKAYLYGDYKPVTNLRLYHRTQYILNEKLIGYSQSNAYYKFSKKLNIRTTFDYRNRTTQFPARNDTLSPIDKYFYSSTEKNISTTVNYQIFYNRRIGMMDISPTLKKRFGNGDLFYADTRLLYRNYLFVRLNVGLKGSYTSNQWLKNIQSSLWLNRDFLTNKLDATLLYNLNSYRWNIKTSSGNHLLSIVSADLSYRFSKDFFTALTLSEEFGNATDPHTSVFVRLNYYLR